VTFMQFFSHHFGVALGKFDTTSGDMNAFAHGKGDVQFMNLAMCVDPVAMLACPYSTLGAAAIVLPTGDPEAAIVTGSVLSSVGDAGTAGFNDLSSNQLVFSIEGRVRTNFFDRTGHQLAGAEYSNAEYTSLNERLSVTNRSIQPETGTWCVYYNFDQYIYQAEPGSDRGFGVFGRLGASDGNPNPVHYFLSVGIGGKGLVPGRPNDTFGIGYYYMDVTSPTLGVANIQRSYLGDEQGFEAYYNIHLTPWLQLSPDIQVISPSQQEALVGGRRESVDTAVVLGFRLNMVF